MPIPESLIPPQVVAQCASGPRQSTLHCCTAGAYTKRFRSLEDGIAMASRYFATVLRATLIPCSDKTLASLLSLKGLCGFSAAMSFLMSARIAVEDASPPPCVDTWEEKKYFNS
jgi:hypothetical protein